jgi:hypothetical protein
MGRDEPTDESWKLIKPEGAAHEAKPEHSASQKTKKPTWRNTLGCSTTPAYSSTSPPADRVALHLVIRRHRLRPKWLLAPQTNELYRLVRRKQKQRSSLRIFNVGAWYHVSQVAWIAGSASIRK